MDKTLISVIVPIKNVYKWENNIQNNINIFSKNIKNKYEFIFIYSLPEDKSVTKLKSKISKNKFVKFSSDNGKGIYSAMNNGIKKATGVYMVFFGADDIFLENSLKSLKDALKKNLNIDIFLFDVLVKNERDKSIKSNSFEGGKIGRIHWLFGQPRIHQGIFYKRSFIVDRSIFFPIKIPVTADYIFTSLVYSYNPSICEINLPIAIYNLNGFSSKSTLVNNYLEHIFGYFQDKRLRKYLPLILISRIFFIIYKLFMTLLLLIKKILTKK